MGTKYVPSSTNVFMGWFEEKFIFPLLTNLSNVCLHFIDSISLIWNETKTEFVILASNVNLKCLKQKSIFSTPQCLMYIANWEQKCMSTNQKTVIYTANWNILIPLRGIFYSQALRFNKICYNRSDLRNSCKRLLKGALMLK